MLAQTVNKKCNCNFPIFISPYVLRDKKRLEDFYTRQQTKFLSDEVFNEDRLISLPGVFPEHYTNSDDDFLEEAAKNIKLNSDADKRKFYAKELIQKGLEVGVELTEEEAEDIMDTAFKMVEKSIDWSQANKKYGNEAARFAVAGTILGIVKSALENIESCPRALLIVLNALHGYAQGMRGNKLYGYIYSRADDDKGICAYQKEKYRNISGDLSSLSCAFETYVKPWVLPFLCVLDSDKKDILTSLLNLPTMSFWRLRYLAFIDQRLGGEISKRASGKVNEIKETDILTINYLKKKLKTLLRIKEGEKSSRKLYELVINLFSGDIKEIEKSARVLNETLAPILGILGFCFVAIGIPFKAVTTFAFGENLSNSATRKIDSFASLGITTQQMLYSLRFSAMEYVRSNQLKEVLKGMDESKEKKELEKLSNSFYNLSVIGLTGNVINIFTPFLKLMDDSNQVTKILKSILNEVGFGLSQYFFPKRRELRGELFIASNKDLFEPEAIINEPPKLKIYRGG